MLQLYNYKFTLDRVIDGDTFVGEIDLGFNLVQKNQRIRLYGVNTPETRGAEKVKGLEVKDKVITLLTSTNSIFIKSHNYDNFGRILADVQFLQGYKYVDLATYLLENDMAVKYLPK